MSFKPELVDKLSVDASMRGILDGHPLDLADLDVVRLLLHGNSIIDWNRTWFETIDDVDRSL